MKCILERETWSSRTVPITQGVRAHLGRGGGSLFLRTVSITLVSGHGREERTALCQVTSHDWSWSLACPVLRSAPEFSMSRVSFCPARGQRPFCPDKMSFLGCSGEKRV